MCTFLANATVSIDLYLRAIAALQDVLRDAKLVVLRVDREYWLRLGPEVLDQARPIEIVVFTGSRAAHPVLLRVPYDRQYVLDGSRHNTTLLASFTMQ